MIRAELPPYEGATTELRQAFSHFPSGVVALLAAWVMRFYPLDGPTLERVQADLRRRRRAEAAP